MQDHENEENEDHTATIFQCNQTEIPLDNFTEEEISSEEEEEVESENECLKQAHS